MDPGVQRATLYFEVGQHVDTPYIDIHEKVVYDYNTQHNNIYRKKKNVYTRSYFSVIYIKTFPSHTLLFSRSSTVEILSS